jgi:hypothetical protein
VKKKRSLSTKLGQLVAEAVGIAMIALVLNNLDQRRRAAAPEKGEATTRENVEVSYDRLAGGPGAVAPRHDHGDRGEERMPLVSDAPAGATLEDLARLNGVRIDKPARA